MALAESRASGASTAASQPTWLQNINPAAVLVGVIVVIMPVIASSFVLTQIFGWSYMLGTIALSLTFLAGYGGMVSLAQMTIAGFAGYLVAILGVNGVPGGIGWPWWLAVPAALILSMIVGAAIGALFVGMLESFAAFQSSAFKDVIVFSLLIPVLLWRSIASDPSDEDIEE